MRKLLLIGLFIWASLTNLVFASSEGPIDFEAIADEAIKTEEAEYQLQQEYRSWVLFHEKRVFGWNHTSSIIIFWVVILIILSGLYFSYMQFKFSVENKKSELKESTVKLGKDGVEISSSIIGLLILIISLAFFYLYLENVYPVQIIPSTTDRLNDAE